MSSAGTQPPPLRLLKFPPRARHSEVAEQSRAGEPIRSLEDTLQRIEARSPESLELLKDIADDMLVTLEEEQG